MIQTRVTRIDLSKMKNTVNLSISASSIFSALLTERQFNSISIHFIHSFNMTVHDVQMFTHTFKIVNIMSKLQYKSQKNK